MDEEEIELAIFRLGRIHQDRDSSRL
jgi:hypothetical protein